MGLDMHLFKIKKIPTEYHEKYYEKVLDDLDFEEIEKQFLVKIERDGYEVGSNNPLSKAFKQVGIKAYIEEEIFKVIDVLKEFLPEVDPNIVEKYECEDVPDGINFKFYTTNGDEIILELLYAELEHLEFICKSDVYICSKKKEVAHWSKSSIMNGYFDTILDEPFDNCDSATVEKRHLEKLLSDCIDALNSENTNESFYFGHLKYDKYYHDEIKRIMQNINEILECMDWENEALYYFQSY